MFEHKKRKTLKMITVVAGAGAAAANSTTLSAYNMLQSDTQLSSNKAPSQFHIAVNLSSRTKEFEVIIRNTGAATTTITQMTPSYTITQYGQINFSSLFSNGELTLQPGQSVAVPLETNRTSRAASHNRYNHDRSIISTLKKAMTITTRESGFAPLTFSQRDILA